MVHWQSYQYYSLTTTVPLMEILEDNIKIKETFFRGKRENEKKGLLLGFPYA